MKDKIQVAIRIRPLNQKEQFSGGTCLQVSKERNTIQLYNNPRHNFTYDYIADEHSSQEDIFENIGRPVTNYCLSGYNSSIFAYGQTGSGKTFTILGDNQLAESRGLLPRCIESIFYYIQEDMLFNRNIEYTVKSSLLEIYQEKVYDLLNPGSHLQIREDINQGVHVENLTEETINQPIDALNLLQIGMVNRHVASTSMNAKSSRSHSVFTISLKICQKSESTITVLKSRFNLVDLAGSERQKRAETIGERLDEAKIINKSLSALGNVINALAEQSNGRQRYVHYRDSKLTFLLKDSLGGNSKTCFIANVSAAEGSAQETLSTLKFAQRAKLVENSASVNQLYTEDVDMLRLQIQELQQELFIRQQQGCGEVSQLFANERIANLERVLAETIRIKQDMEYTLQQEIQRKEANVQQLISVIAKLEEKSLQDRMILKFREKAIQSYYTYGIQHNTEIQRLQSEIEILMKQLEVNPYMAMLYAEQDRLKNYVKEIKREWKIHPDSVTYRLQVNQDLTDELARQLERSSQERFQLLAMIEDLNNAKIQKEMIDQTVQTENFNFQAEIGCQTFIQTCNIQTQTFTHNFMASTQTRLIHQQHFSQQTEQSISLSLSPPLDFRIENNFDYQSQKYKEEITMMKSNQGMLLDQLNRAQAHLDQVLSENQNLKQHIQFIKNDNQAIMQELDGLNKENVKLVGHSNNKQKISIYQRLRDENQELKNENLQLRHKSEMLEEKVGKLEAYVSRVRRGAQLQLCKNSTSDSNLIIKLTPKTKSIIFTTSLTSSSN